MDNFQSDFEYLCRVCAANTKGKYSVPECMDILKTPGLKERVEKYLYLGISEADALPKVLCKTCFRQVEATASLSKIAKHTQKVFRDFLLSAGKQFLGINYENHPTDTIVASSNFDYSSSTEISPIPAKSNNANCSRSSGGGGKSVSASESGDLFVPPAMVPLTPAVEAARRDEVVLNVSVSDPLTRDTQQKMISASQKRQNSDISFTPRSIAQRAFTNSNSNSNSSSNECNLQKTPLPRTGSKHGGSGGASGNNKKYSPPGVINFFHNRSMTAPTITTTLTSNKSSDIKMKQPKQHEKPQQILLPLAINGIETTITKTTDDAVVVPKSDKRKSSKISTSSSLVNQPQQHKPPKQLSLLKASQPKLQEQQVTVPITSVATTITTVPTPPVMATTMISVKSHESLTRIPHGDYEQENEEQLPQRMIIAAAKSEKHKQQQQQQLQQQQQQQISTQPTPIKSTKTVIVPTKTDSTQNNTHTNTNNHNNNIKRTESNQPQPQAQTQVQQPTLSLFGTTSNFDDNILLGKVIRDVDLLKLIIKALKWPVTDKTMDAHLVRLRNSRFLEVMSDTNLLQDTDLTQILGPIIFAAQHLQKQQQQQQQQQQNAELLQQMELKQRDELQRKLKQQQIIAEQQQQQQQLLIEKEQHQQQQQLAVNKFNKNKNKMENNKKTKVMDLASTLTYKLPAETSVQLVPATSENEEPQSSGSSCSGNTSSSANDFKCDNNVRIMPIKKQKRKIEHILSHPVVIAVNDYADDNAVAGTVGVNNDIVVNDNDDNENVGINKLVKAKRRNNSKVATKNLVLEDNHNSNNNNNNSDDSLFDTDDIVLMEDQPHLETIKSLVGSGVIVEAASPLMGSRSPNKHVTFAEPLTPPITRPIIKRRKTVIQATTALPPSIVKKCPTKRSLDAENVEELNEELNAENNDIIETQDLSSETIEGVEVPSNMVLLDSEQAPEVFLNAVPSETINTTTSPKGQQILGNAAAAGCSSNKRDQKMALGQQLLQAIGLKQQAGESAQTGGKEKKTDSVAQIRSALKRSLKQAQEQQQKQQQQQRNNAKEEPIIQDADSTTRNNNNKLTEKDVKQAVLALIEPDDNLKTKSLKRKNAAVTQDEANTSAIEAADSLLEKSDSKQPSLIDLPSGESAASLNDVTSTGENVAGRKRGRKSKSELRDGKVAKTEQSEDEEARSDATIESLSNRRPTRMSKTLSKYYKGPEQTSDSRRSSRSTRNTK